MVTYSMPELPKGCVGFEGGYCYACEECHGGYADCEDGVCLDCWPDEFSDTEE